MNYVKESETLIFGFSTTLMSYYMILLVYHEGVELSDLNKIIELPFLSESFMKNISHAEEFLRYFN